MNTPTRIIGLDPGLRNTGWGVIESTGNHLKYISHGVIKPTTSGAFAIRLKELHEVLTDVIKMSTPDEAAVEETFVNQNPASTLKLGMARGVVLLTPALANLPVGEYSPNRVKKAVVGVGHATKDQIEMMVARLLPEAKGVKADAADALAIAITHAHFRNTQDTLTRARAS